MEKCTNSSMEIRKGSTMDLHSNHKEQLKVYSHIVKVHKKTMKKLELTKNQLEFLEAFFTILKKDGIKQNMSLETIKYYKHIDEPNNIFIKTELIGASRTDIGWFCLMEDACFCL